MIVRLVTHGLKIAILVDRTMREKEIHASEFIASSRLELPILHDTLYRWRRSVDAHIFTYSKTWIYATKVCLDICNKSLSGYMQHRYPLHLGGSP